MYRTVREDSGAWSLLKYAAVLASETARSVVFTMCPKLLADCAGADGPCHTARITPKRSTTAIVSEAEFPVVAAACTSKLTSLAVNEVAPGGGCGKLSIVQVRPEPTSVVPPPLPLPLPVVPPPPHEAVAMQRKIHTAAHREFAGLES